MNQNAQTHSGAWVSFTYASFAASAFLVAVGVFFLPIDLWMKGYLTMGIVMLFTGFYALINLSVDLLYGLVDPRIRVDAQR